MNKIILGILIALVVGGGLIYFSFYGDSSHGSSLKKSMTSFFCTAANTAEELEVLGYAEQYDEVDKQWWGFIVCKETNPDTREYRVKAFASRNAPVTGTALTEEDALKKSRQAETEGKEYFIIGAPFNPRGEFDYRKVEYRVYQENGRPTFFEVYFILRNEDRSAKEPVSLKVNWPA